MKKALLFAAAALAAGVVSSEAQVYSQNIVGYANLNFPQGGKSYLISTPFAVGASNGLNEVFGSALPSFSQVLIWSTANNSYTTVVYDNTDPNGVGAGAPLWYQSDDSTPYVDPATGGNAPSISVGQGIFVVPSSAYTWKTGL